MLPALALLATIAAAQPVPDGSAGGACSDRYDPDATAYAQFRQARELYLLGCHEEALGRFQELVTRSEAGGVDEALAQEALLYLGEVQYVLERRSDATETFRRVLDADPDARLSPLDHDPGAVAHFETVKQLKALEPEPEPPPVYEPRVHWFPHRYTPYGVAFFDPDPPEAMADRATCQVRSVGWGVTFLGTQLVAGGVTVGTTLATLDLPATPTGTEEQVARATALRVPNLVASLVFTASYASSVGVATSLCRANWRAEHERGVPRGPGWFDPAAPSVEAVSLGLVPLIDRGVGGTSTGALLVIGSRF